LSEFDFLIDEKGERKRSCGYCRYFNKIPDHQLVDASPEWANMGICWWRKNIERKDPVVNKYWKPSQWNCNFMWKDIYKGEQ
jgi:hypothetical protein